ncbi:MAG: primosomal protein N' [Cellvibrionales bacterium]|nr:primosomal protein N' [Cellvibrionales bacterium]
MPQTGPIILRVAVPTPLRRTFDYIFPENLLKKLDGDLPLPGSRVAIEFGRRTLVALIIEATDSSDIALEKLKPINDILDLSPILSPDLLKLFSWAANYYQYPIGEALFTALPALLRKGETTELPAVKHWRVSELGLSTETESLDRAPRQKALLQFLKDKIAAVPESDLTGLFSATIRNQVEAKGLIEFFLAQHEPKPSSDELLQQENLTLDPQQQVAMDEIELHGFSCNLIEGVTGSGKTEIYLQAIEKVLRYNRQALVLIPEISLTPQTEKRFTDRFNTPIVTLHSGMTDKQRLEAWIKAKTGEAKIILGTRSAIFTGFDDLGLIILDEEHDSSYKQQDGFKYSARDLAVIRAQRENIPVILGSATPSLESLNNCIEGRYKHLTLTQRANNATAPSWRVIDLKTEATSCGIAQSTLDAIQQRLDAQQQVLVFLNRRGYAPALVCHSCGWSADCPKCDSKLTFHRARGRLICHHCDYQQRKPHYCPSCNSKEIMTAGEGTEQSEEFLAKRFPNNEVIRIDRDSTRRKGAMQEFFATADSGKPCILLGTQMLAKGHHFENVTLVVILDADSGLMSADFRSHERIGQLLIQVAGRSGRGKLKGEVIVQTHQPEHPVLDQLFNQGYRPLALQLLQQRQQGMLPPCRPLAVIRAESTYPNQAIELLGLARKLCDQQRQTEPDIQCLGPLPALMEKRAGRFRFILQVTASQRGQLQRCLSAVAIQLDNEKLAQKVRWSIDVDPQEL